MIQQNKTQDINPFQPGASFHIENSHLICFYLNTILFFILTLETAFSQRFPFKTNKKSIVSSKKGSRDFQNSPPFERCDIQWKY